MPLVAFKDLCLDTCVPDVVGPYWRDLLGLRGVQQSGGDWQLSGATPAHTIWVNTVPEPKALKSRVHLDVRVPGRQGPGWDLTLDPDGLEWCAFSARDGVTGLYEVVVDAADPRAIAQWWADLTGATVHDDGNPWVWLEDVVGFPYDYWVFQPVPEPKTVKNRVHWDVSLLDASIDDLVAAGAVVLEVLSSWTVLADPEGNEFCAF